MIERLLRAIPRLVNPWRKPATTATSRSICDFENVALGVRDAKYAKFDIRSVLERLLLKGSIVDDMHMALHFPAAG